MRLEIRRGAHRNVGWASPLAIELTTKRMSQQLAVDATVERLQVSYPTRLEQH
ncbi:MAG: hypothetical protein JO235_12685 [Chroococcidiopsidaceae cyanobacterium CP_BM_RX_35]|nr:hypothetical protein [Chroococcidiopsidaceae cyanobacterium CP_BM_RX_35]